MFICLHFIIPYIEWKLLLKKEPKYKELIESVCKEFIEQVSTLNPDDIIYIDEFGTDNNIVPQCGWSEKGLRSYAEQSGFIVDAILNRLFLIQ